MQHRQKTREEHDIANVLLDLQHYDEKSFAQEGDKSTNDRDSSVCLFNVMGKMEPDQEPTPKTNFISQSVVDSEIQHLITENTLLKNKLSSYKMNQESFCDNEEKVKYYTGMPSYMTLMTLFEFVAPYIPTSRGLEVGKFEKMIKTLMRLKLNLSLQDIAYRFQVSTSIVSRTFKKNVIHVLYVRLKPLLFWSEREELQLTMPMEFWKDFGGKVAVIIDCFEIFIQRPKSLMARAQTWSSYKHNNTIKFLIGITIQGSISFLSKAWGGRASDKYITEHCVFLSKLLPGDIVLADRAFNISDSIGMYCAKVITPSFTKGKAQFSPIDVENT
ncbi:hypothetical protein CHS0354_013194 [Potamilus streckersoni]|uniref:Transposase n=1 Tax=Potamilus streckersoni TaxID=2493646 RepID=A0AAE0T8V9_9BIVA|nr:hypothetical protein CHS0354_013194 [Potamilus streckersoni]